MIINNTDLCAFIRGIRVGLSADICMDARACRRADVPAACLCELLRLHTHTHACAHVYTGTLAASMIPTTHMAMRMPAHMSVHMSLHMSIPMSTPMSTHKGHAGAVG